jgi:hypothetical protein
MTTTTMITMMISSEYRTPPMKLRYPSQTHMMTMMITIMICPEERSDAFEKGAKLLSCLPLSESSLHEYSIQQKGLRGDGIEA